jgi:hypothetical protein
MFSLLIVFINFIIMTASTKTKKIVTSKRELHNRIANLQARQDEIIDQVKELPIIRTRLKILNKMLKKK